MLTHVGTQNIRTKRLKLRRFTVNDARQMFDNWAKDERVTRYLTWQPHKSPDVTENLIKLWCESYKKPETYNWAIEYDETVIGNISVVRVDENSECADIGYCIGYDYWNKGITFEAAAEVIGYLFEKVGFNRISICHAVKNPASGKVAEKCGLSYEGTMREGFKTSDGKFLDIAYYGILRKEWEKSKKNIL